MPKSKTSGKLVNNSTQTTFMYRCHLSANHPIFTYHQVELTDIITATGDEHALGVFLADFRKKYPQYNVRIGSVTVAQLIISNR